MRFGTDSHAHLCHALMQDVFFQRLHSMEVLMGDPASDGLTPTPVFGLQYRIDPALAPMLAQPVQPGAYNRYRVFDGKLTLDPALMASFAETMARLNSITATNDFLRPNWQLFGPDLAGFLKLPPPNLLALPVPPPSPGYTPGKGPELARAAELSDLMDAIWKVPQVQGIAGRARDEGMRQLGVFEREWNKSGVYSKIAMISVSGVVAAGIVGPLLYAKPTRDLALGFVNGKDIPIPKLDGFKIKLLVPDEKAGKGWGGGATVPLPYGGSVSGSGQASAGGADLKLVVSWDLMQVLPKSLRP